MLVLPDSTIESYRTAFACCAIDHAYQAVQASIYGDTECAAKHERLTTYMLWAKSVMDRTALTTEGDHECVTHLFACQVIKKAGPICAECECIDGSPENPITPVPPCNIQADFLVQATADASQQPPVPNSRVVYIVSDTSGATGTWAQHVGEIWDGVSFVQVPDGAIVYATTGNLYWTHTPSGAGQYFPILQASQAGSNLIVISPYPEVNGLLGRNVKVEALISAVWTQVYPTLPATQATESVFATAQTIAISGTASSVRTTYYIGTCAYGPYVGALPAAFSHDVNVSHDNSHG